LLKPRDEAVKCRFCAVAKGEDPDAIIEAAKQYADSTQHEMLGLSSL
jgi:hypothetical protein